MHFEKNERKINYSVGDKIYFSEERHPYQIIAYDDRFLICVKLFNLKKTYLYTIVDLVANIRGPDNYYTRFDYINHDEASKAIELLNKTIIKSQENLNIISGFYISSRHNIELKIIKIISKK